MNKSIPILTVMLFFLQSTALASTFATWQGLEPDKLASIWLIQRFISPGATIAFYPHGQKIDSGIVFDTPYSKIRRRYNQSSFEALISHYQISDPKLLTMAQLIHDMEINVWEHKKFKLTYELQLFFVPLLDKIKDREKILEMASAYLDALYKKMPARMAPSKKN